MGKNQEKPIPQRIVNAIKEEFPTLKDLPSQLRDLKFEKTFIATLETDYMLDELSAKYKITTDEVIRMAIRRLYEEKTTPIKPIRHEITIKFSKMEDNSSDERVVIKNAVLRVYGRKKKSQFYAILLPYNTREKLRDKKKWKHVHVRITNGSVSKEFNTTLQGWRTSTFFCYLRVPKHVAKHLNKNKKYTVILTPLGR